MTKRPRTVAVSNELFKSDEYTALVPVRDRGFEDMNIVVTHTM
jgi:hypothetical protein